MELRQLVDQHRSEVLKIQNSLQSLKKEHAACYDLLMAKLRESASVPAALEGSSPDSKSVPDTYRGGLVELLQAFVERSSATLVRYQSALDHYEKELGRLQGVKQEQQACLQLLQQSHVLESVTPPPSVVARAGGLPSGYLVAQLSELLQNLNKGELRLNGNSDSPGSKNATHQVNWIVEKYDRIISSKDEQEHQISLQLRMFQRDYEKCIDLLNAYLVEPFKSPFPAASSGSVYFSPNDLYAKLSAFIAQYKTERGGGMTAVEDGETLAVASLKDELVRVRRDVDTCFELLNANSPNSLTPHPRMRTLREEVQKYIDRVVEESKQWQLIIEDYGVVLEGKERSEANLARILKQTLSQQEECLRTLHQAGFITDGELDVATNPPLLLEGSNTSAGNNNNNNNEFSTPGARKAGNDLASNTNNGLDTPASDTSLALQTPSGHGDGSPTLAAGRAILSGVRNLLDHYEHLKRSSPSGGDSGGPMTRSRSKLALEMELVQDEYIALRDLVASSLDRELQRVSSLTAGSGADTESLALKPPTRPTASSPGKSRSLYYDVQYLTQLISFNETAQVVQEYTRALEIISEHVSDMQPWQHLGDRVHVYQYLLQGITQMANMLSGFGPPATRRSSRGSDSGSSDLKRRMRHAEAEVARLRPYYDQFKECVHFLSANFRSPIGTDGKEVNERSLLKQLQHLTVEYSNNIDTYHAMVLEFQHTAQELEKSSSRAKDLRQRLKDREASIHKRTSENDDLRREISDLEAKQRAVEPQMKEYEKQIEALQKEVAALREHGGDVSSLQRRLEDSEKKAKEATLTASEREEELSLAHSKALDEIASLQEQLYARDNQATELELLKDERSNCMALLRAHEQGDAGDQNAGDTSEDYPAGTLSDNLATFIQGVRDESSTHNEARNDEAERIARLEAALAEAEARNQALESELAEQAQELVHLHAQTPEAKAKRRSLHTDHDPRGGRDWTPTRADGEDDISTQVVDEPDNVTVSPTVKAEDSEQVTVSPSSQQQQQQQQQQGQGNVGSEPASHSQQQQSPTSSAGPGGRGSARSGPGRSKRGGKRGPGSGGRVQQPKPSSAPSSPEQPLADATTPVAAVDSNNDDAVVPEVRTEDEEAEMAAQEDGVATSMTTTTPMPAGQISPPTGGLRPPRHTLHDVERKYQFGQLLGTGSFAEVKYATSRENGNQFAAKIVDKTRWMKYLDCIQREVDILKELDHENIIHLYDVFDTQTTLFMMTELSPGGDLLEHIEQRGPLRENEAKNVMRKMGEALKYLHKRGVVHRDLKPENILLGTGGVNDPNVKLCDFGHSAYLSDRDSGPNTAFGTFIYLAPEVILTKKYDCPMDLWSLGVILYICFSGQFPFDGQSDAELFEQIVHGQYDFRDPCWRVVSPEAREVVRSLLSVDVNQRLTAETLLSHPWLTGERPASQSNSRIMSSSSSRQHGNHPPIQATTRSHSRGAQPPAPQPRPGQYNSPHMQGHRPPGAPPQREQFGQAPWRGTHPVGASPMHASPRAPMGYAGPRW